MVAPADRNQNEVFTGPDGTKVQCLGWHLVAAPLSHTLGEFQCLFKTARARFRSSIIKDGHQFPATLALCHQLPALASHGIAFQRELDERRELAFGFHGFHDALANLICTALATLAAFRFLDPAA